MAIIKLAKAPKHAFNKNRAASDLLKMQVQHLRTIGEKVSGEDLAAAAKRARTEGQAAAFIARVTRMLHPEGAGVGTPPPGAVPVATPAPAGDTAATRRRTLPRAARKTTRRKTRTRKPGKSATTTRAKTKRPAKPRRTQRRTPR